MSSSQAIALLISAMVMMLPMMLLSGMVFPIENLPSVLQPLPYIIPARWYIDAIRKLMIMGLPLSAAMKEIIILSSMAIVFMGIALKKFKDKLE